MKKKKGLLRAVESSQEFIVGIGTDADSWYLDKITVGNGRFVWSQASETLVRLDSDLNIIPGLAKSWETLMTASLDLPPARKCNFP